MRIDIGAESTIEARKGEVMASNVEGETIILSIEPGRYYVLDQVGTQIWELVQHTITFEDLLDKITAEFDVDLERCAKDLQGFLQEMFDEGLIEVCASSNPTAAQ